MRSLLSIAGRLVSALTGLAILLLCIVAADALGQVSFGNGANLELVAQFPGQVALRVMIAGIMAALLLGRAVRAS